MQVEAVSVAGNACLCPQIILEDVPHDSILLAAGNVVQSVSISSGNLQGTYRAHSDLVSAMCTFQGAANNTLIVSASFDGQVDAWDPVSMTTLQSFQLGRPVIKLFNTSFWIEKSDEAFDKHFSARVDCIVALVRSANPEKKSFEILKITVADLLAGNHSFALFGSTLTPRLEVFAFDAAASAAGNGSGASSVKTYSALVANGKKGLNFMICAEREGLNSQQLSVYYSMNDPVIAFATNSSAGSVAVGHDNGQISLLTNVSEFLRQFWQLGQKRSSEILAATHHWHSHPVLSLCFSPDGRLLYSGGEENVLVIWDLKDAGRNYLPRLGAPISRIIACQSVNRLGRVLVTTVDNTLRLVNVANFEVEWMWQSASISTSSAQLAAQRNGAKAALAAGAAAATAANGEAAGAVTVVSPPTKASIAEQQRLQLLRSLQAYRFHDDHAERAWFAQCLVNPRTGYLLINGNPGVMQEFDFRQGIIRQNHPLLQHHRVSRKDPGMRMFLPSITRFAVDATGRLLVTIDVKRGEELPKEYSLKIWEWFADDEKVPQGTGAYRIVAQLDKPHGDYPVTSLAVSQQQQQTLSETASNDQLLQHVMIVTGSNDGTLKLWTRKTADDVHDMYTTAGEATTSSSSSAAANHHKAAPSSSSSRSSTAVAAGNESSSRPAKAYALHQLRWKCHYAFQYRVAPVLAVTFSLDASLLVVAHENLITCWDPQTVSLRASLTLTQPRKVTYLSVLEPRAAAEYGQGVGDVYLVAGTNASVTVFSLLTQQELWTVDGEAVEAIATASSEQFALTAAIDAQHRFRSSLAEEGWIAIATTTAASSAATESDGDTDAEDGAGAGSGGDVRRPQCHTVTVFSPVSATPLLTERVALASKVTSLAFLRRTTTTTATTGAAAGVMGLAVLTSDSDVWLVQPRDHPCHFTPGVTASVGATSLRTTTTTATSSSASSVTTAAAAPLAQVKTAALPTVALQQQTSQLGAIDTAGDLSGRVVSANKAVAPMGRAIARKDWLRTLLPENTEDLPKISEIAGSYLRSMVTNHAPVNHHSSSSGSSSSAAAWASSNQEEPTAVTTATATRSLTTIAMSSMTRVASVQDTDDLLRRVSAKWASVLGKRSAEEVTATATTTAKNGEEHRTPSKKSKKDTTAATATATAAVVPTTPVAPVTAAAAVEEASSKATKSRSASKKTASATAAVPPVATAAPATVAAALPPLPEHEEVSLPAPVPAASTTTATATRTSSRKRKGSDLSSVASSVDEDDDGNVSDAASTATDITTPSVAAARRSARQKTMSLVAMAPASAAPAAGAATSTRATRSRK